jgi:hypothetical protein
VDGKTTRLLIWQDNLSAAKIHIDPLPHCVSHRQEQPIVPFQEWISFETKSGLIVNLKDPSSVIKRCH